MSHTEQFQGQEMELKSKDRWPATTGILHPLSMFNIDEPMLRTLQQPRPLGFIEHVPKQSTRFYPIICSSQRSCPETTMRTYAWGTSPPQEKTERTWLRFLGSLPVPAGRWHPVSGLPASEYWAGLCSEHTLLIWGVSYVGVPVTRVR